MDHEEFSNYLMASEQILWTSKAGRGLIFDGPDWFSSAFAAVFTAVSAHIFYQMPLPFFPIKLVSILFFAFGAYFMIGHQLIDAWSRSRTRYAVTNRRILIHRQAPFEKFQSLSLDRLPQLELVELHSALGDIWFGPKPALEIRPGVTEDSPPPPRPLVFRRIEKPREVFKLIDVAIHELNSRQARMPWKRGIPTA